MALPASDVHFSRVVLVVGQSGVGKSTLTNMLYHQNSHEDCCTSPAVTGGGAAAVTRDAGFFANVQTGWAIVDTIGLGDAERGAIEIVQNMRAFIKGMRTGVHAIVMVMKYGRLSDGERANLALLLCLFRACDVKGRGVLVLTHWEGDIGEEEADLAQWLTPRPDSSQQAQETCKALNDMVNKFATVVLTNNSVDDPYPDLREKSLKELLDFVECTSRDETVSLRAVTLWETIMSLWETLRKMVGIKDKITLDDLRRAHDQLILGECPVCMEALNAADTCVTTCSHTFHKVCLARCAVDRGTCPMCRSLLGATQVPGMGAVDHLGNPAQDNASTMS